MAKQNTQMEKLEKLLSAVGLKDRAAFSQLYALTSAKLFAVILRIVRKQEIAEELLQEVFIKIWHRADSYHASRGNSLSWLITIARNRSLDWIRVQRGEPHSSFEEEMAITWGETPDPASNAETRARSDLVARCIEELSEGQQASIKLAYLEGLTHTELAQRLKKPMGTIKSWIRRALASLGSCVERLESPGHET